MLKNRLNTSLENLNHTNFKQGVFEIEDGFFFEDEQCVCACRIMQANGGLPITPAKNGTHKRKSFPQNGLKA